MNKDKTVYLNDIHQILEDLEKEADRQGNYKGYIVLMDAAARVQELKNAEDSEMERKE